MVIYEVNISINNDVFQDYYDWLIPHAKAILTLPGFLNCEIGLIENQSDDNKNHLRVSYTLDSYDNLQHYLTNHAEQMRNDATQQFSNQFDISRRIILEPITLEK